MRRGMNWAEGNANSDSGRELRKVLMLHCLVGQLGAFSRQAVKTKVNGERWLLGLFTVFTMVHHGDVIHTPEACVFCFFIYCSAQIKSPSDVFWTKNFIV